MYVFKIVGFLVIQTFYILYIFDTTPHTKWIFNRLEFINEGALILLSYVMLVFSGLTPISDLMNNLIAYTVAEWVGIGIAIMIAMVNFYVMFKMTWDKIKAALEKRKLKKL